MVFYHVVHRRPDRPSELPFRLGEGLVALGVEATLGELSVGDADLTPTLTTHSPASTTGV